MSYKPEVQTAGNGDKWSHNNLAFATREEAEASARDLESRWMLVTAWRVAESDQPVNYSLVDGQLKAIKQENSNG